MTKLLIALLTFFPPLAYSGARGDWGSAGDMEMPYTPKYEFRYECQAELTDHEDRQGDGKLIPAGTHYLLLAIWRFELSSDTKTFWQADDKPQWVALLDGGPEEVEFKKKPADTFDPQGAHVKLSFRRGRHPAKDLVKLQGFATLAVGKYEVTQGERFEGSRADSKLSVRVNVDATRAKGEPESLPPELSRALYVECEKRK